jgi:hypothetical protein
MIPIDRFETDIAIYTVALRSLSREQLLPADYDDAQGSGER